MRRPRSRKHPRGPAGAYSVQSLPALHRWGSRARLGLVSCAALLVATIAGVGETGSAIANGETRTLEIYHTHTKESAAITYKRNGQFDRDALEKLNWLLRDWRRDEPINMDPRLFDIVWEVRQEVGSREPLNIVSAYRAPETNAMLRHRSRAVAKHSQHMLGKAMDFFLPDVSMSDVREIGLRLQRGGVGYYPTAYNPFVHLDAGSVRHWPRMSRDQLARLFPDGKTVHIPSDGKPMPGYDAAAAEIEANGGSVSAYASAGDGDGPGLLSNRKGKSFFAALFGGGDDEDAEFVRGGRTAATRSGRGAGSTAVAAYAPSDDRGGLVRDTTVAANSSSRQLSRPDTRRFDQQVVRPVPAEAPPAPVAVAAVAPAEPEPQALPAPAAVFQPVPAAQQPVVSAVPLPVQRPVTLASLQPMAPAGPQMVWQQGPSGVGETEGRAAPVLAAVPLPLARPSELAQIFSNVPLPQPRPVQVASAVPMVPALPPVLAATVAPPPAVPHGGPVASPVALPAAPLRTAVAPAPEQLDGTLTPGTFDKAGLTALFTGASFAPAQPRAVTGVATSRTRTREPNLAGVTAKPTSAIAYGFGQGADLPSDHFAGPAVKPLPVTSFAKR